MPSMTQELSRIAHGIAASRRQRAQDARARLGVVRERKKEVVALLHGMKVARECMGRERRRQAATEHRRRRDEVKTLMVQFERALASQHRARLEGAAEQRAEAAAFMHKLNSSVAAMRDAFSADQGARARACRELGRDVRQQLAAYGRDRRHAMAGWSGNSANRAVSANPPAAVPAHPHHEPAHQPSTPTNAQETAPSPPAEQSSPPRAAEPAGRTARPRGTNPVFGGSEHS